MIKESGDMPQKAGKVSDSQDMMRTGTMGRKKITH